MGTQLNALCCSCVAKASVFFERACAAIEMCVVTVRLGLRPCRLKTRLLFSTENFMFGFPGSRDEDKIFVIDFGLSVR